MATMGPMPMPMPMPPPPPPPPTDAPMPMPMPMGGMGSMGKTMMHMTFFWGDRAVVLFPGWPGDRGAGMYLLCLLFVLVVAALVEGLAAVSRRAAASSAVLVTVVHAAKMALAYLVMLAVMSFNVGVLIAAVAGHGVGFLLARSGLLAGGGRGRAHLGADTPSDPKP